MIGSDAVVWREFPMSLTTVNVIRNISNAGPRNAALRVNVVRTMVTQLRS